MKNEFHSSLKRKPLLPYLAICANWIIIGTSIAAATHFNSIFLTFTVLLVIGARQHALFVMIHEAAHLHIARNKLLNDWTSDLCCAFPLLFDTEVYRKNHLKHHRHLNTNQDPDWMRKAGQIQWTFPTSPKQLLLFVPHFIFVSGPIEWASILWRFSGFGEKARWEAETRFLLFKLSYFTLAGLVIFTLGVEKQALLYWFVPMFFILPVVGRIRSVAEHFAVSYKDPHNSSRDVRVGHIEGFLLAPHSVSYHLTHHEYPHIPFYHLAQAHHRLSTSGEFSQAHINQAYFFPFKNSVLRDALRPTSGEEIKQKAS